MFELYNKPYTASRYPILARNGMVCTGNNLASSAGLQILKEGGNAIDAAIATAATLTVVEPTANGIGSDAFAIVWYKDEMYGLNSSGKAPMGISIEKLKEKGITEMPKHGWTPVTVPGAPKAWVELSERFGKLPLKQVLAPAISYARNGYPVTPETSRMWKNALRNYQDKIDDPVFAEWFNTFTVDGKAPEPGQIIKLKNHADTLEKIAETKGQALYGGVLAEQIEKDSIAHGGYIRKSDLENHKAEWVNPVSVHYHGYDVWELPPNGQGIVALMALNILKEFQFTERNEEMFHHQFEAMKMAFADGMHHITDPRFMKTDIQTLLDPNYGKLRAQEITENAKLPEVLNPYKSGTVYLCTADQEGNMVSFIQSNYMGFGSGVVVKDTGISLQNRGHDFSLHPDHVNSLAPGKKTYHTIIPGFLTKNGKAIGPFGVMGGYMQPQGHVQVVMNMIDFHLNPQQALDAPRWQWIKDKEFHVEHSFDANIVRRLQERGHLIQVNMEPASFGRGQIILRMENGTLMGGSESRTDSAIASW